MARHEHDHWQRSFHRTFRDPSEIVETVQDVIDAALDVAMDAVYTLSDRDKWDFDNLRGEARAFAGRFREHPSWRSAWERTSRAWSDTD